jgi:hypothetical protein
MSSIKSVSIPHALDHKKAKITNCGFLLLIATQGKTPEMVCKTPFYPRQMAV